MVFFSQMRLEKVFFIRTNENAVLHQIRLVFDESLPSYGCVPKWCLFRGKGRQMQMCTLCTPFRGKFGFIGSVLEPQRADMDFFDGFGIKSGGYVFLSADMD